MLTEKELEVVFNAAPDGIVVVDREGIIREVNARAEEMFGYGKDDLVGREVEVLVPERVRDDHERYREGFVSAPRHRPMRIGADLGGRRADGTEFPVDISLSPVESDGDLLVIAAIRDVTERIRLREWGVAALRAAEEERERIALELHDDMAQRLAALMVHLRLAARAPDDERSALLQSMRDEIQECTEVIRNIAQGLRPPALDEVGVVAALQSLVRKVRESSEIDVEMRVERGESPELGRDGELALYRIVQEALSNVVRHAGADRVVVRLEASSPGITAVVEDDGRGFDPIRVELYGLGIVGMTERARNAGGELEIDTRPGAGTRVRAFIPARPDGRGR